MAGFIILDDGRAYAASDWSYDAVVERIAKHLPDTDSARELSDWLLKQCCVVQGPGLGSVDLRERPLSDRRLFTEAAENALIATEREGPAGWCDSAFYPGWLERFRDLIKMMESVRRGEPPSAFNPHMIEPIPPSDQKSDPDLH